MAEGNHDSWHKCVMHQAVARSQLAVCRRKTTNWGKKTAAIGIGEKVDHNHLEVSVSLFVTSINSEIAN